MYSESNIFLRLNNDLISSYFQWILDHHAELIQDIYETVNFLIHNYVYQYWFYR
jgi:hypothetical protein